jgi:hypothetical protein
VSSRVSVATTPQTARVASTRKKMMSMAGILPLATSCRQWQTRH